MKIKHALLITGFALLGACSTPVKESAESSVAVPEQTPSVLTLEQKRAEKEKLRIAQEQKRKSDWEKLVAATPFYTDENNVVVFNKVDELPSYTGGEEAMRNYLRDNLNYPEEARRNELEGTLFVEFIIAANGSVRNVVVSEVPGEQIDASLRQEAVRVVNNMPKWIPGRQAGKWVDVKYSLPITFKMS
jgi:TonB family protein